MSVSFCNNVLDTLKRYEMLNGVNTVVVALSGGADSMSLLHFLSTHSKELGIEVQAAHLNHNIRGDEALHDEDFVRKQCAILGIKLNVRSLDILSLANDRKIGLEECGRQERYKFFRQLCDNIPNCVCATAHTLSDNAETVLLNITRGCGTDGLCGIPPVREGLIRPLINCTRADVEAYCMENNVPFVTDSSNLVDEYSRNKIRLNVIPQLCLINPSAEAAINRMSSLVYNDHAMIKRLAKAALCRCKNEVGLDLAKLLAEDECLVPHMIILELERYFNVIPEKRHIDLIMSIISERHGAVELKKGKLVRVVNDSLVFEDVSLSESLKTMKYAETPFMPATSFFYNGKNYKISEKMSSISNDNNKINKKIIINRLSCGIISCDTVIRTRKSGDIFSPYGRNCTKTVKKLFSEMKLSPNDRATRLLIANGNTVLWIEGIGVSQLAAVDSECDAFYEILVVC